MLDVSIIDQAAERIANNSGDNLKASLEAIDWILGLCRYLDKICKKNSISGPEEAFRELTKLPDNVLDDILDDKIYPHILEILDRKGRLEKTILILSKAKEIIKTRQPRQELVACPSQNHQTAVKYSITAGRDIENTNI